MGTASCVHNEEKSVVIQQMQLPQRRRRQQDRSQDGTAGDDDLACEPPSSTRLQFIGGLVYTTQGLPAWVVSVRFHRSFILRIAHSTSIGRIGAFSWFVRNRSLDHQARPLLS